MCEDETFQAVRGRMSCSKLQVRHIAQTMLLQQHLVRPELSLLCLLQVHIVDGGDHGLKVHAGKESKLKTEAALQQVLAAICGFADTVKELSTKKLSAGNFTSSSLSVRSQQPQDHESSKTVKLAGKRSASAQPKDQNAGKRAKPVH